MKLFILVDGGGIRRGVIILTVGDCGSLLRLRDRKLLDSIISWVSAVNEGSGNSDGVGIGGGDSGEASSIYTPDDARLMGSISWC